ncbi:sulfate adenylyltransferase subunit CysN [Syntrophotalea acetylenivorans]|uniref:sulfate adenylyltransferase subunit CysN n=1 Tax=Syntrophotalea acetylenivorans TaxID=1842532 RepID=UPI0009FAC4A3|nr:sulfate adenylyltransferase subunit CysN [Syntrophotalea acetylenivorans]
MAHQSELIAEDIHAYLKSQEEKGLLRFITCGSVDDGKSTLIGRLLWDSKMVFEDQLAALSADSKRVGTQGENIDYALLLDGLQAEREQGITIDVAYRYFSTDKRKFIVADTPGHEQYTRNMVTGASTAQVAVILIDARKGILTQTRRHSYLVSLVGIRRVVLAVNKMDLVDYSAERFEAIREEYQRFASGLGFEDITAIPISALEGDNVLHVSERTPWYEGPGLLEHLESVQIEDCAVNRPFRLPVQWVNRPDLDFRGFCGTIVSGTIRPGDPVVVSSSGQTSRVARIVTLGGDLPQAVAGQAVTLTLTDEIDISRGDLLAAPGQRPAQSDQLEAHLAWLHEQPLAPGRSYLLKTAAGTAPAQVRQIKHKIDVNTLQQLSADALELNEVGLCQITVSKDIAFDPYRDNDGTGSFILIDRLSNATVAAGMIHRALSKSTTENGRFQPLGKEARAALKGQQPKVVWFSGPLDESVSELPQQLESRLHSLGRHTCLLDGEKLRDTLGCDLDDQAHLQRVAEVARLMTEAGLIVLVVAAAPPSLVEGLNGDQFAGGELLHIYPCAREQDDDAVIKDHVFPLGEQVERLLERIAA